MYNKPIDVINKILRNHPYIKEYEHSVYQYVPKTLTDNRIIWNCYTENDVFSTYEQIESYMGVNDGEIAFHSRCNAVGSTKYQKHIPLIDFSTNNETIVVEQCVILLQEIGTNGYLFDSGRSFHLYVNTYLSHEEWIKFMGRILLMNVDEEIVDSRWVGHRLLAGYASLRLTANSDHYKKEPELIHILNGAWND